MQWVHLAAATVGLVLSAAVQGAPAALIDTTFGRDGEAVAGQFLLGAGLGPLTP